MDRKKRVYFDKRALKEFDQLLKIDRGLFDKAIRTLEIDGFLLYPVGKRLEGYKNLFEIRVREEDFAWRALYSYLQIDEIVLLKVFVKKSNKTPINDIKTALRRLKDYM